ncbi:competence protein ComK [Salirhabdus euzebyi]|uniref:Competence protein ComK n=1 Tax=Salirhabdus euzebyi TaxID=394506 RepID=A0A841Q8Y3_9BACI|nr:competence protein ComK [Salirhabdus euzebyi]MBB6454727.1 competence protein ComK [Salirhabdus euzebyi]
MNFDKTEYEISPFTVAVIPEWLENGEAGARVLEKNNEYVITQSPRKLIDQACKFFGSSLKGRQEGTKGVCGITHKAPIAIDPHSGMFFFPTTSPHNSNCTWIAHSHISHIRPISQNETEVHFKNGESIKIPVSYGSMMNQVQRTAQFRYKLTERIQYKWTPGNEKVAEPFV